MRKLAIVALVAAAILLGILASLRAWSAEEAGKVEAKVVGIQVSAAGEKEDFRMRPFNASGTSVAIRLEAAGPKSIVGFDESASKIAVFADDKGTDLLKAGKEMTERMRFGFPRVSEDGRSALFEVRSGGVPAAGSASLKVKLTAALKVASQKKTDRAAGAALKAGSEIKAGPAPLKIEKVKPEGAGISVSFKTDEKFDNVIAIRFFKDGKEIKSRRTGTMTMAIGKARSVTVEYDVEQNIPAADVEVEYWTDLQTIETPVDVQAGLGL
jgi:hypothetical protein